jgi:hypothetical protein
LHVIAVETADEDALETERLANAELGNGLRSAADAQAVRERMRARDSTGEQARQAAVEAVGLREERDEREPAP